MRNLKIFLFNPRRALLSLYFIVTLLSNVGAVKKEKTHSVLDIPLFIEHNSEIISKIHNLEIKDDLHINYHHKRSLHRVLKEKVEENLKNSPEFEILGLPSEMVSAAFVVIGDDVPGEKVIMDTGSHLPVLTLPQIIENNGAFVPLDDDKLNHLRKYSYEWLYKCPVMLKKGFTCGKERYGSGGMNSVIGQGKFAFRKPTNKDYENNEEYYNTFLETGTKETAKFKGGSEDYNYINTAMIFQLNTIYGHSALGILGLSFGEHGFEVNPFLTSLNLKRKNFIFRTTNSLDHEGKQDVMIKFGIDYQEKDYHWIEFTDYYKQFSMFNLYSVGAHLENHNRNHFLERGSDKPNKVIFDSGTNVIVLPGQIIKSLVSDLIKTDSKSIDIKKMDEKGNSYQICWESGSGIKILIKLETFVLEVDLDLIGIIKIKKDDAVTTCNYLLDDSFGVVPVGFSLWHMFDVIWDSDMKKIGFKPGNKCDGNKCRIIKYDSSVDL